MNIYSAIGLGITIAGFVITLANIAVKQGRLLETVEKNEERDSEERYKTSSKFAELYNRISTNESAVNALQTNVCNLAATCGRIENKLDRVIESKVK